MTVFRLPPSVDVSFVGQPTWPRFQLSEGGTLGSRLIISQPIFFPPFTVLQRHNRTSKLQPLIGYTHASKALIASSRTPRFIFLLASLSLSPDANLAPPRTLPLPLLSTLPSRSPLSAFLERYSTKCDFSAFQLRFARLLGSPRTGNEMSAVAWSEAAREGFSFSVLG